MNTLAYVFVKYSKENIRILTNINETLYKSIDFLFFEESYVTSNKLNKFTVKALNGSVSMKGTNDVASATIAATLKFVKK